MKKAHLRWLMEVIRKVIDYSSRSDVFELTPLGDIHLGVVHCDEDLLKKETPVLDRFAEELLKKEELDYDEIEAIFKEFGKSRPPVI